MWFIVKLAVVQSAKENAPHSFQTQRSLVMFTRPETNQAMKHAAEQKQKKPSVWVPPTKEGKNTTSRPRESKKAKRWESMPVCHAYKSDASTDPWRRGNLTKQGHPPSSPGYHLRPSPKPSLSNHPPLPPPVRAPTRRSRRDRRAAAASRAVMTPSAAVAVALEAPAPTSPALVAAPAPPSTFGTAAAQDTAEGAMGAPVQSSGGGGGSERRSRFRRICVYCGSAKGKNPSYQDAAVDLGNLLVSNQAHPSFPLLPRPKGGD